MTLRRVDHPGIGRKWLITPECVISDAAVEETESIIASGPTLDQPDGPHGDVVLGVGVDQVKTWRSMVRGRLFKLLHILRTGKAV